MIERVEEIFRKSNKQYHKEEGLFKVTFTTDNLKVEVIRNHMTISGYGEFYTVTINENSLNYLEGLLR